MNGRRLLNDGTPMSKLSKVVATWIGVPYETPPLVDLTMMIRRLPVVGQKPNTSPKELVFTSQPIAVPVDSAPLTWIGVCQEPAGPVRRFMKAGRPLCQQAYRLFLNGDDSLWSVQMICLSVCVWPPSKEASKVQVAPLSTDL